MKNYGSTLYEYLIYRVLDRYGEDAHADGDTEGDHAFLLAMANPVLRKDEDYQAAHAELKKRLANPPDGVSAWDWKRHLDWEHLALVMDALRRHGYLDNAPTPQSTEGLDFL